MEPSVKEIDEAAGEAIFGMHLSTIQAIRFVMRNAGVDEPAAQKAVEQVQVGYKAK